MHGGSDTKPVAPKLSGDISGPPRLSVVTGLPDDARADLEPGHRLFPHFLAAYHEQDEWTRREHEMFWRSGVHLWPPVRGRPRTNGRRAYALRAASERHALSVEQAASALDLSLDSLRKGDALDRARELLASRGSDPPPGLLSITLTDYVLPRIYVPGRASPPEPSAYRNLSANAQEAEPVTEQLAAAIAGLDDPNR